jgi:hypothetical protein
VRSVSVDQGETHRIALFEFANSVAVLDVTAVFHIDGLQMNPVV